MNTNIEPQSSSDGELSKTNLPDFKIEMPLEENARPSTKEGCLEAFKMIVIMLAVLLLIGLGICALLVANLHISGN